MGSGDFQRLVFEKVFKDDIDRLRSMEDMWKTRQMPTALEYDEVSKEAQGTDGSIAQHDQLPWTLAENFAVFSDRYAAFHLPWIVNLTIISLKRLSARLKQAQAEARDDAPSILTFDKDDEDTLDFVAASANLRSLVFGIETKSKFDIKRGSLIG